MNVSRFRFPSCAALIALASLPALAAAQAAEPAQITINRTHHYTLTPATTLRLDGRAITPAQLTALGSGFSTQVTVTGTTAGLANGQALAVDVRTLVRGPLTATDPPSVLRQPLAITGDTVLVGLPAGGIADVAPGTVLQVSGYRDINGSIVASRIDGGLDPAVDWKLAGFVSGLAGSQFSIGEQAVDAGTLAPVGCEPALGNGDFVELEAVRNAGYTPGATLTGLTEFACEDEGIDGPPGAASIEGIVSAVPDPPTAPPSFTVAGITIVTSGQTVYRGGTADDVEEGVRLEAEGDYDAALSTLQAREIRFTQAQIRLRAPVAVADVHVSESIDVLGVPIAFSPQTRDEDDIAADGLSAPRQVEVRGFLDGTGAAFATRLRERGNPDDRRIEVSGPVEAIAAPLLHVLGQTIDTSAAIFRDADGQVLTATQFFAQLHVGVIVSAEEGTYVASERRLTPRTVELEDAGLPVRASAAFLDTNGVSRGTLGGVVADGIFATGFQ